jgi:hypothetical protein
VEGYPQERFVAVDSFILRGLPEVVVQEVYRLREQRRPPEADSIDDVLAELKSRVPWVAQSYLQTAYPLDNIEFEDLYVDPEEVADFLSDSPQKLVSPSQFLSGKFSFDELSRFGKESPAFSGDADEVDRVIYDEYASEGKPRSSA